MRAINVTRLRDDVEIPQYGTAMSAGFDLAVPCEVTVLIGQTIKVRTGLVIGVPRETFLMIVPRSSTFSKWGVSLANTVGILDYDYRGPEDEVILALRNESPRVTVIPAGTRVAQGIVVPYVHGYVHEVDAKGKSRGGWGSSGD